MKDFKITYDDFSRHLKNAVAILHLQDTLYDAVASYNEENHQSEFEFGYFPTLIDNVVELLEALTEDDDHWISYWMFDLDCGRRYYDGCIVGKDGKSIKLETIDDLWAFLHN